MASTSRPPLGLGFLRLPPELRGVGRELLDSSMIDALDWDLCTLILLMIEICYVSFGFGAIANETRTRSN